MMKALFRVKKWVTHILLSLKRYLFKLKLRIATPEKRVEMMRRKFYHCGNNVRLRTTDFGTEPYLISIHDNVTCASGVKFINHDGSIFQMARFLGITLEEVDKVGTIVLYENAFVGAHTILMPNTSVGRNSVVAAGSVVTKRIPDGEVWGGVPAKFIMKTEDYARKVLENSRKYPWKYDAGGKLLSITGEEVIKLRQQYLFEQEALARKNVGE